MLESLLNPVYFFLFVLGALFLGRRDEEGLWRKLRPVLFLLFNLLILGWVLGNWKGLGFYLVYIGFCGFLMRKLGPARSGSVWICGGVATLLILGLIAAKYYIPASHNPRLPLGMRQVWSTISLSFLTFRLIHVALDAHAGLIPNLRWMSFLNYAFFSPISVAGPIQKYNEFEAGFLNPPSMTPSLFIGALKRLLKGIGKKVLVAGVISPYVLGNMEPAVQPRLLILLLACALYSVYIYFDFSGYTDIAIGGGALFGIKVPENFNKPWLATNLQDFWNRWHMTLTAWLRTYLFYPLNKFLVRNFPAGAGKLDSMIAVIITFAIAGAWHGDTLNFLIFGLMHGIGISAAFAVRSKGRKMEAPHPLRVFGARALTMAYVSLAWIPFVYPVSEIPWLLRTAFSR